MLLIDSVNARSRRRFLICSTLFFATMMLAGIILSMFHKHEGVATLWGYFWMPIAFAPAFPFLVDIVKHMFSVYIGVICCSAVLYYYGAIFTSISLFSLMAKKWHNLINVAAAVLLSGAIYLLPFSTDLKRYPIRGPVFLTFSIIALLVVIALVVIRVRLRLKQHKQDGDFKLFNALLLDAALFLTTLTAALSVCDLVYVLIGIVYNMIT